MKPELVDVNTLSFDPSNARLHGNKNLDSIKGSLVKFGQQTPIVIDEKGVVLKGNGTLAAAKSLSWQKVWAIRASLDNVQKAAYAIADNRSSELATWDNDVLAKTILSIRDDFDMGDIGFDDWDMKKILGEDDASERKRSNKSKNRSDSSIKTVQLSFTEETAEEFQELIEYFQTELSITSLTDTILEVLRTCRDAAQQS